KATMPGSTGQPLVPLDHAPSANLSAALLENCCDSAIWSSASTLMVKCVARSNTGKLRDVREMDHKTSGGSSETEAIEQAVTPASRPSCCVATTVTPVPNWPRQVLNARESISGCPSCNTDVSSIASGMGSFTSVAYSIAVSP